MLCSSFFSPHFNFTRLVADFMIRRTIVSAQIYEINCQIPVNPLVSVVGECSTASSLVSRGFRLVKLDRVFAT